MRGIVLGMVFVTFALHAQATDYERFEDHGKFGLKDTNGNVIIPASFEALGWSDGNFSLSGQIMGYRQKNRWGLMTVKKEFITKAVYESLTNGGGDRFIAGKLIKPYTVKFGCIGADGKMVIPFAYDAIELHDLRAIVMLKNEARYEYGIVDLAGQSILPIQYKKIEPIGTLRYAVQNFSGKTALCNEQGKWVTDFSIDHISSFEYDLAVVYDGWKQGVMNRNGEMKISPAFREIKIEGPGLVKGRKTDEWKVINNQQKEIAKIEADTVVLGEDGWNHVQLNGLWGLFDPAFKPQWPMEYDFIGQVKDGKALVRKNGKYNLLKLDQSRLLPDGFDSLCLDGNFIRTMTRTFVKQSWTLYDTFGIKKTSALYEFMGSFNGKFIPVRNRGYWGAVDRYGQETIACVYDSLLEITEDWVAVKFKGHYGIVSIRDEWKIPPQSERLGPVSYNCYYEIREGLLYLKDFQGNIIYFSNNPIEFLADHFIEKLSDGRERRFNFKGQVIEDVKWIPPPTVETFLESEGLIGIRKDGKYGFVDLRGRLRIANRYDGIGEFHEGLAAISLLGKWGFINTSDQIVIQPSFEKVGPFSNGVSRVTRNRKTGLINQKGTILLELRYDSIRQLPEGLFLFSIQGQYGLSTAQGRVLIEPRFDQIKLLPGNLAIVKKNERYGLLTIEGMSLFPMQYSELIYSGENRFLVHEKFDWVTLELK